MTATEEKTALQVQMGDIAEGVTFTVEANLMQSGNFLSQVFIGLEPVVLVQPEVNPERTEAKLILTAVDTSPEALVELFEVLLDAAREIVAGQAGNVVVEG